MLAQERYEIILDLLKNNNVIKVNQMMGLFNVSIETVRRDLEHLEKQGLLKRVYGGAVLSKKTGAEPAYSTRAVDNLEEKKIIGKRAAQLIDDGDTVIIDLGTTTLEVAKNLKNKKNLTVITNSINIALELVNTSTMILLGGVLREGELTTSGFLTEKDLQQFNVDKALIGVGGITIEAGITDYHVEEAQARKKMINQAQKIIAVTDYSKFGVKAFTQVCELKNVHTLVIDNKVDEDIIKEYRKEGIEVIIAY